jgi:hypothetical protein
VVPFTLPPELLRAAELHGHMMNMETRQGLAWEYATCRPQLSAVLLDRLDWAGTQPPAMLDEVLSRAIDLSRVRPRSRTPRPSLADDLADG